MTRLDLGWKMSLVLFASDFHHLFIVSLRVKVFTQLYIVSLTVKPQLINR